MKDCPSEIFAFVVEFMNGPNPKADEYSKCNRKPSKVERDITFSRKRRSSYRAQVILPTYLD